MYRFWQFCMQFSVLIENLFSVFRFWTIFPTVLQFPIGPNAPLFTDFIFTAEISHTYTKLFSVEQSCVSRAITLQYFGIDAQTRFLVKLSHKLIISFWILGDVYSALPEAWSKWSLSSGSYLDFKSTKKEKFLSSFLLEGSQLSLNGMLRCPNAMTTSIIDRTPFIVQRCSSAACLCSLALMSLPGQRVFRKLVIFSSESWCTSLRAWASRCSSLAFFQFLKPFDINGDSLGPVLLEEHIQQIQWAVSFLMQ